MDYIGIALFVVVFFPLAIWIYLTPRQLLCRNCCNTLAEGRS